MIEFQQAIEIDRAPSEVFAFLSDVERAPTWQRNVLTVAKTTAGAVRAGTEFHETVKGPAGRVESTVRVAVHRPDELIALAGAPGFADFYCAFELAPTVGGGTRLVSRTEFRMHGLWKLLQPIIARQMRREVASELAALKRVLESARAAVKAAPAAAH